MDGSSWEDVFSIISNWLKRDEWESEHKPGNATKLSGHAVDSAERLLQRLIYEKATTRPGSALRRQRDLAIAEGQPIVLNAWIHVAQQQQDDPILLAAAAERAELALARIVDWYNQGGCWLPTPDNRDALPVSSFINLCRLWLQSDTVGGFSRAADLLISWTEGEDETSLLADHKSDVAQCFNDTMHQCTNLLRKHSGEGAESEDLGKAAAAFVVRMDFLREAGWVDLEEIGALARKVMMMESLRTPTTETEVVDSANKSRLFEENAMFQQMTALIQAADVSDYETIVDEVIPRLMGSKTVPTDVARNISGALVEFFIRVKDAKQTTQWIQRLEMIDAANSHLEPPATRFSRLLAVFELWTETVRTEEAVWRADELLRRCESLEGEAGHRVESHLHERGAYLKMLRMWANQSKDADLSARKVHEAFTKLIAGASHNSLEGFEVSDVKLVVAAMTEKTKLKAEETSILIDVLERKQDDCSAEVMEETLAKLVQSQQGRWTGKLVRRLRNLASAAVANSEGGRSKLPALLTNGILQSSLPGMPSTNERLEMIEELGGFDENQETGWDLDCYNTAIAVLLRNEGGDKDSVDAAKKLLNIVFTRLAEQGTSEGLAEGVALVLDNALRNCMLIRPNLNAKAQIKKDAANSAALAEELLVKAEDKFLLMEPESLLGKSYQLSPIPLTCFEKVVSGLYATGQSKSFEKAFFRLYDYFRIGCYENLLPERKIMGHYMKFKLEQNADGNDLEGIFNEWAGYCRDIGHDVDTLEDKHIYNLIFWAHSRHKNGVGAVNFAEGKLMAAKAGQADVEVASYVMEKGIQAAADCQADNLYDLVVTQLFRPYGMDKSLQVKPPLHCWRDLLYACTRAPEEWREFASKLSIISLTELRKAKKADVWAYSKVLDVHWKHGGPASIQVLRVVFQSCCEDGYLSLSLKNRFERALEPEIWREVYTSNLLANEQEPVGWSANSEKYTNKRPSTQQQISS